MNCPADEQQARLKENAVVQDGSTPLHYAAAFGQSHIIKALVEAGCPVDSRDDAQNTPLHLAAGMPVTDSYSALG